MKAQLVAFVVLDIGKEVKKKGKEVEPKPIRSAPDYIEILPKYKITEEFTGTIDGKKVHFRVKFYHPDDIIVEAEVDITNPFDLNIIDFRKKIIHECLNFAKKNNAPTKFYEEYCVYCIYDYKNVDALVNKNKSKIISLMRSEKSQMDEDVVKEAFVNSSIKYSPDDVAVIGWDGAIIFSSEKLFDESVEILIMGNIELLNARIVNEELEDNLMKLSAELKAKKLGYRKLKYTLEQIIKMRTNALLNFGHIKKNIVRHGDWYAANLYDLAIKKFHVDEIMHDIEKKLDTFENIYQMVYEKINGYYMLIVEILVMLLIVWEVIAPFLHIQ